MNAENVAEDVERKVYPRQVRQGCIAQGLFDLLRMAGNEWGALGVALAAADMTDIAVLVRQLQERLHADLNDGEAGDV